VGHTHTDICVPKQLVKVNKIWAIALRCSATAISRDRDHRRSGILERGDGFSRSLVKRESYTLRTTGDGLFVKGTKWFENASLLIVKKRDRIVGRKVISG
jgi:hypothetical protein